jgi:hypothetical protein
MNAAASLARKAREDDGRHGQGAQPASFDLLHAGRGDLKAMTASPIVDMIAGPAPLDGT